MPTAVIVRVNKLASDQPTLLTFYNCSSGEISDSDADAQQPDEPQYESPGVLVADDAKITGEDSKEESESDPSNGYDPDIMFTPPDEPTLIDSSSIPATGFVDKSTPESFKPTVEYEPTTTELVQTPAVLEPATAAPTDQPATDTWRRLTRERKQMSSYTPSMTGKS
jgi:hypothetical protein